MTWITIRIMSYLQGAEKNVARVAYRLHFLINRLEIKKN